MSKLVVLSFAIWLGSLSVRNVQPQLIVNIKNSGGEVFQERIVSNISEDVIELEYTNTDGSVITQLIDFKNEVEINRIIILGEQERGDQQKYQTFCFAAFLNENDFITSDAMSKLRQKHPATIRQAEEDKGKEIYEMDLSIDLNKSSIISPHLNRLCGSEANVGGGTTNATQAFTREIDLKGWTNSRALNKDVISLTSSVWRLDTLSSQSTPNPIRCNLLAASAAVDGKLNNALPLYLKPCQCQIQICIPWFPCSLKYCRGKDASTGKTINYRCGIRTCKKCRVFLFQAKRKQNCLWEEEEGDE